MVRSSIEGRGANGRTVLWDYMATGTGKPYHEMTPAERLADRIAKNRSINERATAHLPRLLYERLDELGVDLMLTYPSWTLGMAMTSDQGLRAPACQAVLVALDGAAAVWACEAAVAA